MNKQPLDPRTILVHLIGELGVMSTGWGVDILTSAIEYLESATPQEYLEKKSTIIAGVRVAQSSVFMWSSGHPRDLPGPGHGQPVRSIQ